jgi:hypothetical protein
LLEEALSQRVQRYTDICTERSYSGTWLYRQAPKCETSYADQYILGLTSKAFPESSDAATASPRTFRASTALNLRDCAAEAAETPMRHRAKLTACEAFSYAALPSRRRA